MLSLWDCSWRSHAAWPKCDTRQCSFYLRRSSHPKSSSQQDAQPISKARSTAIVFKIFHQEVCWQRFSTFYSAWVFEYRTELKIERFLYCRAGLSVTSTGLLVPSGHSNCCSHVEPKRTEACQAWEWPAQVTKQLLSWSANRNENPWWCWARHSISEMFSIGSIVLKVGFPGAPLNCAEQHEPKVSALVKCVLHLGTSYKRTLQFKPQIKH